MKKTLLALLTALPLLVQAQEAKKFALKGVVTYYFNANYGDKPDTGAKAYLLTEKQAQAQGITYDRVLDYKILYAKFEAAGLLVKPEKRRTEEEKKLVADMKQLADTLNKRQFLMELRDKVPYLTADGGGVFSKNVLPGTYYVFVKSAHRKGASVAEIDGQIEIKKIEVKDDDVEVPVRFGMGY